MNLPLILLFSARSTRYVALAFSPDMQPHWQDTSTLCAPHTYRPGEGSGQKNAENDNGKVVLYSVEFVRSSPRSARSERFLPFTRRKRIRRAMLGGQWNQSLCQPVSQAGPPTAIAASSRDEQKSREGERKRDRVIPYLSSKLPRNKSAAKRKEDSGRRPTDRPKKNFCCCCCLLQSKDS